MKIKDLTESEKSNFVETQFVLGLMYENGIEFSTDIEKAKYWYMKAAENGSVISQFCLSQLLEAEEDYDGAFRWCQKSAENSYAKAIFILGAYFWSGKGCEKSIERAIECYQSAAKKKYGKAASHLGSIFQEGIGVDEDIGKAVYWYKEGVNLLDCASIEMLGNCYAIGEGVKQNDKKAFSLLARAAEMGSDTANIGLARVYSGGLLGEKKDSKKAVYHEEKARELFSEFKKDFE